jgi:Ca-activated chloride channel family protein
MRIYKMVLGILLIVGVLAGCGSIAGIGTPENTIRVLAGSELKDIEPLLEQIHQDTGVALEMSYIGTLDGAEQLMGGAKTDMAWFSHAKYLTLLQGESGLIASQEKIMLSPVVLGVKQSKAEEWGWVDNPDLTWADIAARAGSGELKYAMTNPASSNSGFTSLVGVASALSDSSDALTVDQIDTEALQEFFKGQALTAGSSGWLAESYVREQEKLDGLVNYESVLLQLNQSGQLQEPLYLVYPKEGIITADYPLMLINEEKREDYTRLVEYLLAPEMQRTLMERTLRRPANPDVEPGDMFPDNLLVEVPFPNNLEVIDTLLFSYLDEQRIPSHAFFVLDTSGSMEGEGIRDLKASLSNLTGIDQSITGRFARFRQREQVTFLPFSNNVNDVRDFQVDETEAESQSMEEIRSYINILSANGGTAIFSSLIRAYQLAAEAYQQDPERYYSIVLMSDGENTEGVSYQQFLQDYNALPAEVRNIRTYTIMFGRADEETMEAIAETTGGRAFDAKSTSLNVIFKQIRGYQ